MDRNRCFVACLVSALTVSLAPRSAAAEPRYLPLIQEELTKMGIRATCSAQSPTRGRCSYTHRSEDGALQFDMHLDYSDDSDTIYHFTRRYLVLPPASPRVLDVLRRLMQLNWTMLIAKFQWNPEDGEIRLSAVENTDSNFDRRAFRSTLHAFHNLAERYHADLTTMVRGVDEAETPPATKKGQ